MLLLLGCLVDGKLFNDSYLFQLSIFGETRNNGHSTFLTLKHFLSCVDCVNVLGPAQFEVFKSSIRDGVDGVLPVIMSSTLQYLSSEYILHLNYHTGQPGQVYIWTD